MSARSHLTAALLLFCIAAAASARELQADKPYAASLYDCVVKANLLDLKAALDVAGLKALLSNPALKMTLVAPDAAGFQTFYKDCQDPKGRKVKPINAAPYCSLAQMLADKKGVTQLMKYHLLPGAIPAVKSAEGKPFYPASNRFYVYQTYQGMIVRMRYWQNAFQVHGTGRDAFIRGDSTPWAVQCGAGMMYIVDNVMTMNKDGCGGVKKCF